MSGLLGFIIFCAMCAHVLTDNDGQDCIFDWETFESEPRSDITEVDFSGLQLSTLEEGDETYHYLTGTIVHKQTIDDSFRIYYVIQKIADGDDDNVVPIVDLRPACYFFDNIRSKYLLPISASHNNYPQQESFCPVEKGTREIYPVNSSQELMAPSELENGRYYFQLEYMNQESFVGGLSGIFNVLRD